jgi:hypothetical protein
MEGKKNLIQFLHSDMSESTLVSFRRAIAIHLAQVTGQSTDDIFPLVQQNISRRKASHSVFYVVIKRLQNLYNSGRSGGGAPMSLLLLDENVMERLCSQMSAETQEWVLQARRTNDMLLFDPQPHQLIRLAVESIVRGFGHYQDHDYEVGHSSTAAEGEGAGGVLGKRAREETNDGARLRRRGRKGKGVVIVDGVKTLQDENGFCCMRRTVLTGFMARFLSLSSRGSLEKEEEEVEEGAWHIKVITDQGRVN